MYDTVPRSKMQRDGTSKLCEIVKGKAWINALGCCTREAIDVGWAPPCKQLISNAVSRGSATEFRHYGFKQLRRLGNATCSILKSVPRSGSYTRWTESFVLDRRAFLLKPGESRRGARHCAWTRERGQLKQAPLILPLCLPSRTRAFPAFLVEV